MAPSTATGAVELVALEAISGDETFKLREEGDVSALATSIGRVGQLAPVEVRMAAGPASGETAQWQVLAGFRRLAALKLLQRDRVLVRLHDFLPDEDAWALALCHALLTEPLDGATLELLQSRIEEQRLAPWALELLDDAIARAPVPTAMREKF